MKTTDIAQSASKRQRATTFHGRFDETTVKRADQIAAAVGVTRSAVLSFALVVGLAAMQQVLLERSRKR